MESSRLADLLRPHYKFGQQKAAWREDKQYLRWYPAAEVILYCALSGAPARDPVLVNALIDKLATMTSLEESIGTKLRQGRSARGPSAKTREIIQRMASRMAEKDGLVQQAAELTFNKDGLGTSGTANRQLWKHWAKKLGHQA